MSHYTVALQILLALAQLVLERFYFYFSLVFYILGKVSNKTIVPLALAGYEMIITNS